MSKISPKRRSGGATSESRLNKESETIRKQLADAREKDQLLSFTEIAKKLDRSSLPASIQETTDSDGSLIFYQLEYHPLPTIQFSLVIRDDLSYQLAFPVL